MASTSSLLTFFVLLAAAPSPTGASEMFPALRKRKMAMAQTQKHTEAKQVPAQKEESEQLESKAPAEIPLPVGMGVDGYPQLPKVSDMLNEASGTLKSVSSQASGLQAQVVQAQMQSEAKMAKQKAAFEEKLKAQEQGNKQVIEANDKIKKESKQLKASNAALKTKAREIEAVNKVMRKQLRTLQSHIGVATDFTEKSLAATDDKDNAVLAVLKGGARHHRHHALVETASSTKREVDDDSDDEDSDGSDGSQDSSDDEDSDEEGPSSFLTLSMKRRNSATEGLDASDGAFSELEIPVTAPPSVDLAADAHRDSGDLLEVLARDVARLAQQEKESEKKLKQLFIKAYRAGSARHKALLAQQQSLNANRTALLKVQTELKSAMAHVDGTRSQLEAKLRGVGQYLQKLAHFAMAPEREVPHLLEVLPKGVAVQNGKAV